MTSLGSSWRHWNIKFRRGVQLLGGVMGILLLCLPLLSQGVFGRIVGTVTDQSGGVVSGATVTVVDTDRGVTKTLETNDAGEYNAATLNPGKYKVRAEAKGFKTVERENILLEVGKELRVDVSLVPGAVAETMTITESVPLVETTNAVLGGTVNNADINDMPLNGRNYQNLVSLRPGVMVQPGGGPWTQSTNNVRPDESVWMVDGILNVEFYDFRPIANMPSPFSDGATILPVDAIQEFNLAENPKAEYGWKPGAVVNVGIRSGTNEFHGSAYGFYRSAAWDARNMFNPDLKSAPLECAPTATPAACAKLPTQLKQFGGVLGGPIKKDKLFFFAGYEGLRSLIGNAIVTSGVPETISTGSKSKSMVDAIMALQTAGVPVSPVSLSLAGCPSGTLTTASTCTGGVWPSNPTGSKNFVSTFPNTNVTDNGVAKLDYHITNKHTLNGSFVSGNYTGDGEDHPFVNKIFEDTNLIRAYTVSADWVYAASSKLVNDARFGYDLVNFHFLTDDGTTFADGKGFALNTGVTQFGGFPNVNLKGFEKLGSWHNRPQRWGNSYYDFQDNVSYLMGKHTLKFGGEFAHIDVTNAIYDTGRGQIKFNGGSVAALAGCTKDSSGAPISCALEDFFAGLPSNGQLLTGNAARDETWKSYAAFVQDDWRMSSRLTLNLGLRYSYVSPIKEINGLWGNFDPTKGLIQEGQGGQGSTLWHPDYKDFSPRVGFAWDLGGNGKTVVRGGFSILYSTFSAVIFLNQNGFQNSTALTSAAVPTGACTVKVAPGVTCPSTFGGTITLASTTVSSQNLNWDPAIKGNLNGGTVFPTGATPACTAGSQCSILAVDPNLTTPYMVNWSLGVQHAFGNNLSLEVGYVGNHGSRLTGFRDINQTDAAGNRPFGGSFPFLKWINQFSNDGRSNYDSLQTTLTKRVSHGFSFTAGYTYGHGLDNNSLSRSAYLPQDSSNPGAEYGNSDFDVRHRFTFTTTYNIPGIKGFAQMLEGWKLNSIISIQSPQPWLISDLSNDFRGGDSSDRWDFFGDPGSFRSGANSLPYCSGPGAGGCSVTSGVDIFNTTSFSAAQSTAMWNQCVAHDRGTTTGANPTSNLAGAGCFVVGNSVMTPPPTGSFGNMGRNIFRDSGFKNVDFSIFKTFTLKERYSAQFRVEFFNLFNRPTPANPYGSANGYGTGNDPSAGPNFGCGCATADIAAGSPMIGSGGPRAMQLGLKLQF